MKKFVYVVAYLEEDAAADGLDMCISFAHTFVKAEDEEQAYSVGMAELDDLLDSSGATLVNNYVIEIPG